MIVMMMVVMGCNSGGVAGGEGTSGGEGSGAMMEVGRSAEGVFYKFIELVTDSLGLNITTGTPRDKVSRYFTELAKKIEQTIESLRGIEEQIKSSGDKHKSESVGKSNQEIEDAKNTLITLKGHIESLKDIGDANKVVEVQASQSGVTVNQAKLEVIYDALKGIVTVAVAEGIEEPKKSAVKVINTSLGGTNPENGAKVLTAGANAGGDAGLEAAAIVSAVSGKEILAAIVGSSKADATGTISSDVDGNTSALKFARGGSTASQLAKTSALAGAVSGGIALRSLVKDGKLASHSGNDSKGVEVAGVSATNKLLGAVDDVVREIVKKVFDKIKQKLGSSRNPKLTV
nr:variable large family protein [Borrelia hispanica]